MSNFTFKEKGHRYELDGKPMTGVTTVLGVLGKPQLINWAARMTADWIRENAQAIENISPKEPIDRPVYAVSELMLQEAIKAHTRKKDAGADKGKILHGEVEGYVGDCLKMNDGWASHGLYKEASHGLRSFVDWAESNKVRFLSSEQPVYSEEWFCAGTPDFTFEKDGKRFVGDLKTYKRIWDIVPHLQTAAYAKMIAEQTGEKFDGTVVVNINKETHELTDQWRYALEEDIKGFESALYLYKLLK